MRSSTSPTDRCRANCAFEQRRQTKQTWTKQQRTYQFGARQGSRVEQLGLRECAGLGLGRLVFVFFVKRLVFAVALELFLFLDGFFSELEYEQRERRLDQVECDADVAGNLGDFLGCVLERLVVEDVGPPAGAFAELGLLFVDDLDDAAVVVGREDALLLDELALLARVVRHLREQVDRVRDPDDRCVCVRLEDRVQERDEVLRRLGDRQVVHFVDDHEFVDVFLLQKQFLYSVAEVHDVVGFFEL